MPCNDTVASRRRVVKVLILADDLSGAADTALGFTRAGWVAEVLLRPGSGVPSANVDVVAVDTDTRPLTASCAIERTLYAYRALRAEGQRLYKKIDSTLRGNWAFEVAALQPIAGIAVVAPSFPSVGRTVRGGNVYVDGQPLEETSTWRLECGGRPAGVTAQLESAGLKCAHIDAEALRNEPELIAELIGSLASRGVQAVVVDAQTERALRALADATMNHSTQLFWVGSGGLAADIAASLPRERIAPQRFSPTRGSVVTVVGTLSDVSERQCAVLLERAEVHEIIVSPELLRLGARGPKWIETAKTIATSIASGYDILVRIERERGPDMSKAGHIAGALATLVAPHFQRIGSLIATGGETARAILEHAGVTRLRLIGEIEPGVPLSRVVAAENAASPYVVTKAGAFGSHEALYSAWKRLTALRHIQPLQDSAKPSTR